MLRMLLGEQPRQNNGLLEEAIESMVQTTRLAQKEMEKIRIRRMIFASLRFGPGVDRFPG